MKKKFLPAVVLAVFLSVVSATTHAEDEFGTKKGRYRCEENQAGGDGKYDFKFCVERHRIQCPAGYSRSAVDGADMCTKAGAPSIGASCDTGKPRGTQKVRAPSSDGAKGEIDLCIYEMPIIDRAGCDEGQPKSLGSNDDGFLGIGDERSSLAKVAVSKKLHSNGWTCVVEEKGKSFKLIKPKDVKLYNGAVVN